MHAPPTPAPEAPAPDDPAAAARAFYRHLHSAFDGLRGRVPPGGPLAPSLVALAWQSYEDNVTVQCEGEAELACKRGCASCCALRVVATAPEVLVVVDFLRQVLPPLQQRGIDLAARIREADARTRGASEARRLGLRQACPFVAQGVCVIYAVRPLACRSHVSFDLKACVRAMRGENVDPVYSPGRQWVRSLVQNALQSSLRDAGLPWGLYELNQAVLIGLDHPDPHAAWRAGEALFAPAQVHDIPEADMAAAFDELKASA